MFTKEVTRNIAASLDFQLLAGSDRYVWIAVYTKVWRSAGAIVSTKQRGWGWGKDRGQAYSQQTWKNYVEQNV